MSVIVRVAKLEYTEEGIKRIAKAIQATLTARKWTGRKFAREIQATEFVKNSEDFKANHGTISRYIAGQVREPQNLVMQAIAPFIYRVLSINGDEVELDLSSTYEDDWLEFAKIGTTAFEADHHFRHNIHAPLPISIQTSEGKNGYVSREVKNLNSDIGKGSGAVGRLIRAEMKAKNKPAYDKKGAFLEQNFREFAVNFPSTEEDDIDFLRRLVQGQIEFADDELISFIALALRNFTGNERYTTIYLANINSVGNGTSTPA